MSNTNTHNRNFNELEQGKDRVFENQLKTIFHYLTENTATASMVSECTGIPQKNICRFKRDLELSGRLKEIEKKHCKITGFRAWYLTTNPLLFPVNNQLNLF